MWRDKTGGYAWSWGLRCLKDMGGWGQGVRRWGEGVPDCGGARKVKEYRGGGGLGGREHAEVVASHGGVGSTPRQKYENAKKAV